MSEFLEGLAKAIQDKETPEFGREHVERFFMGGYDYKDFFKICFSPVGLKKFKRELISSSQINFWNTRDFNTFYDWDMFVNETQKEDYVIIKRV